MNLPKLLGDHRKPQDRPVERLRRLQVIDVDGGFDDGVDFHIGSLPFRRACRKPSHSIARWSQLQGLRDFVLWIHDQKPHPR